MQAEQAGGRPLVAYLFIPLLSAILTIGAAGTVFSVVNAVQAVENLAGVHTEALCKRISDHLDTYFAIPVTIIKTNRSLLANGIIDSRNQEQIQQYLLHQTNAYPTASSIYFGNSSGGFAGSGREGNTDQYYITGTVEYTPGTFYKYGVSRTGEQTDRLVKVDGFDSRIRPWFQGALAKGDIFWTDPYPLFTEQDLAIAVSTPVYAADSKKLLGVVSTDIFLSQLNLFLQESALETGSKISLLNRQGELLASSTRELPLQKSDTGFHLLRGTESTDGSIRIAAQLVQESQRDNPAKDSGTFDFFASRLRYFAQFHTYAAPDQSQWFLLLTIPAEKYLGTLYRKTQITIGLLGIIILLEIILSVLLAKKMTQPLRRLIGSMQNFPEDAADAPPRSLSIREFEMVRLAYNRSTTRVRQLLKKLQTEVEQRTSAENDLRKKHTLLQASLKEKDLLLKEVYHRTKNNLNLVISLINLQTLTEEEQISGQDMDNLIAKIQSMEMVNSKLYKTGDLKHLDIGIYLKELAELQLQTYNGKNNEVSLESDVAEVLLDMDRAVSCGLIVSELISNSLKYAFSEEENSRIRLSVGTTSNGEIQVSLANNGKPLPEDFDIRRQQGFGLRIVLEMTENQLGGNITVSNDPEVCFTITFPYSPSIAPSI